MLKDMKAYAQLKLWRVPFGKIRGDAELEERIVQE